MSVVEATEGVKRRQEQAQWEDVPPDEMGDLEEETPVKVGATRTYPFQGVTFWGSDNQDELPFDSVVCQFLRRVKEGMLDRNKANEQNRQKAAEAGIAVQAFYGNEQIVAATGWKVRALADKVLDVSEIVAEMRRKKYYAKLVDQVVMIPNPNTGSRFDKIPQHRWRIAYRMGEPSEDTDGLIPPTKAAAILDYYGHKYSTIKGVWLNPFIVDNVVKGRHALIGLSGVTRQSRLPQHVPDLEFGYDERRGLVVVRTSCSAYRKRFTETLKPRPQIKG